MELKKGDRVLVGDHQRGRIVNSVAADDKYIAVEIDSVMLERTQTGLVPREDIKKIEE